MSTTKNQPTNPFVYVIAAVILAMIALWLRFIVDALESQNQAIESATDVKNILKSPLPKEAAKTWSDAAMPTGTVEQTPTGSVAQ